MKKIAIAAVILHMVTPVSAFADEWEWKITPYLWAAGIDGSAAVGPINANVSMDFKDVVDVLRGAALLRVEAQSERHGLFGDLVYLRLREENAKDTIGGSLEAKLDSLTLEGAYFYRWTEKIGLELGIRYWDFETTLVPAVLPQVTSTSDWTDGFVGIRYDSAINQNWSWLLRGNLGAGGSDFSAGLQMDFRRKFSGGNELTLGLRVLDFEYSDSSGAVPVDLNMSLSGLAIGYAFDL